MSYIIGSRFNDTDIPKDWRKTVRPLGKSSNIIWMDTRYPSASEKNRCIRNNITSTEVCIIFDANDNAVEFITK